VSQGKIVLPLVKLFQYGGRGKRKFQIISAAILLYIFSLNRPSLLSIR
jgi:hypothetical protein